MPEPSAPNEEQIQEKQQERQVSEEELEMCWGGGAYGELQSPSGKQQSSKGQHALVRTWIFALNG